MNIVSYIGKIWTVEHTQAWTSGASLHTQDKTEDLHVGTAQEGETNVRNFSAQ